MESITGDQRELPGDTKTGYNTPISDIQMVDLHLYTRLHCFVSVWAMQNILIMPFVRQANGASAIHPYVYSLHTLDSQKNIIPMFCIKNDWNN